MGILKPRVLGLFTLCLPLLTGFTWPEHHPLQPQVVEHIPGTYMLLVQRDYSLPDMGRGELAESFVQQMLSSLARHHGVEQIQLAVYETGRQEGDGIRCLFYGAHWSEYGWHADYMGDLTSETAPAKSTQKALESLIGYQDKAEGLYALIYSHALPLDQLADHLPPRLEITHHLPGQYLLLTQGHVPPEAQFSEHMLDLMLLMFREHYNVNQIQLALYGPGQQEGDGLRCLASIIRWPQRNWRHKILGWPKEGYREEYTPMSLPERAAEAKRLETLTGCYKNPEELYSLAAGGGAIDDGIVDVPFLIPLWAEGLRRDKWGRPFFSVPGHRWGTRVHIYLSPDDPLLPEVTQDKEITVRGFIRAVENRTVVVDAALVDTRPWD